VIVAGWRARLRWLAPSGGAAMVMVAALVRAPAHAGSESREALILSGGLTRADSDRPVERVFVVPPGTSQIDLDLTCAGTQHDACLDFGARGPGGIRGWSMAGHGHVHIDALSASYGYLPGAIEPGEWHVMLGAAPDHDEGERSYQVTIRLSDRPTGARPVLRSAPGWFAGDLHVHSGHSDGYHLDRLGHEVPVSVRDLNVDAGAAHLDFLAVTDHNTVSHWIDVDRAQATSPDLLLLHGREITTARGHFNAIGERRFTDFRLGPERPMRRLLADVAKDGAFLSVNHAWLSSDQWCAGCGWMDRDAETLQEVSGIEVLNGSTPVLAGELPGWTWWADLLNRGERLVAVGGSDVHDPIDGHAAIGRPSTVVWASALSEDAIVAGLKSGRVFVRAVPKEHSFVDLAATSDRITATMGQAISQGRLTLTAHLRGVAGQQCSWIRRGNVVQSSDVHADDQTLTLSTDAVPGDWFSVIVRRHGQPSLLSNAVYVQDERGVFAGR